MKHKGVIIGFVLLGCIIGLSIYITKLTRGLFGDNDEGYEKNIDRELKNEEKFVTYLVSPGLFIVSDTLLGEVIFDDDAIEDYDIEGARASDIKVTVGQMVRKNETLCSIGGNKITTKTEGIIVGIDLTDNKVIHVLDFSKSKVHASVPQKRQMLFHEAVQACGTYGQEKDVPLELVRIEPRVEADSFEVYFRNKFAVYENTKIEILITYMEKENVIFVPKEFVRADDNERTYVTVLEDNGKTSKYYVIVGEENAKDCELLEADELNGKKIVFDIKEAVINGY